MPAPIAEAVSRAAHAGTPIVVTGCGTSEHGAMAIAEQLADALRTAGLPVRVEARQALDAALDPRAGGLCIGVSHEGTTRATVLALEAARAAGAATASIGAQRESPLALVADHALTTPLVDGSWCHTVAYASSILAGAAIGRAITRSAIDAASAIQETLVLREQIDALAAKIHGTSRILTVGLGADLVTARELALKIEEGARIPSTALHLESLLHGHLAGCDADRTALVLFAADSRGGARRDWRLKCAAGAAGAIGIATIAIGEATALSGLPGAVARLAVPPAPSAPRSPMPCSRAQSRSSCSRSRWCSSWASAPISSAASSRPTARLRRWRRTAPTGSSRAWQGCARAHGLTGGLMRRGALKAT